MKLKRIKLGQLIEKSEEINSNLLFNIQDVKGISIQKKFIETKAEMTGVSLKSYLVVKPDYFAYVPITSRNGEKITLAHNTSDKTFIVSSSYVVFKVKDKTVLDSNYLFMFFNRPEFDRYSRFNSWGSAREAFSWEEMEDVIIDLPDLPTQQKYAQVYLSLIKNQKAYESGLDDLKLLCDAYIENLRRINPLKEIGPYIICTDRKTDTTKLDIRGISNQKKLSISNSRVAGVDKSKYLRIDSREFGYSPIHINDGSIAFNASNESYLLSPIYKTFKVKNEEDLFPEYLMMWFSRKEFDRYCWFHAFGSARDNFEWDQMCQVSIPIPDINIQKAIANIYKVYECRKQINEKLKSQIKIICPILIKGSIVTSKES